MNLLEDLWPEVLTMSHRELEKRYIGPVRREIERMRSTDLKTLMQAWFLNSHDTFSFFSGLGNFLSGGSQRLDV